jgi:hypothetical protein
VYQPNASDNTFKPLSIKYEQQQQPELTQAQLPMTCGFYIPPLKLKVEQQTSIPSAKVTCVNSYLSFTEETAESTATEFTQNSPSIQQSMESDKCFDMSEVSQEYQLPQTTLTSQVSQAKSNNGLFVSRQEMSVGQLFEAWNYENQTVEMPYFLDQKAEKATIVPQETTQDSGLLGKRPLELSNQNGDFKFNVPEPPMKRHELSIFNRKSIISTGAEDKELFRMMLGRESSINDDFDTTMGVDLMDFNNPFCAWAKAI